MEPRRFLEKPPTHRRRTQRQQRGRAHHCIKYDMVWLLMPWYDMVWHDNTWHAMTCCYVMMRYDLIGTVVGCIRLYRMVPCYESITRLHGIALHYDTATPDVLFSQVPRPGPGAGLRRCGGPSRGTSRWLRGGRPGATSGGGWAFRVLGDARRRRRHRGGKGLLERNLGSSNNAEQRKTRFLTCRGFLEPMVPLSLPCGALLRDALPGGARQG